MNGLLRCVRLPIPLLAVLFIFSAVVNLFSEPIPLKRAVELALKHSTLVGAANAEEQRALSSYLEARDQYLPQVAIGSGLGKTWGYPLSLEGSAPSIVNFTSQSSLVNPALRDYVRSAKTEWQASTIQSKDQRDQVIQETVLSYAELSKWENLLTHLLDERSQASKMEQIVNQRIQEGVDNPLLRTQAKLTTARARLRIAQAQGAIDVLRNRLSQLSGLPAASIETVADSMPALPEVKREDDLEGKAEQNSLAVQFAQAHAKATDFRARGEHRALWPTVDFAAQYALLASFNNYENYFRPGSFQQHNATIGLVLRFPFFNPSQHAHAQAADAEAVHARSDVTAAKEKVSEETLKLQRAVEQLAASQEVADLEYQIAQSNFDAVRVRVDASTATLHDAEDARIQANERYNELQDANFELERGRIQLLRATGGLESWVEGGK
ncbi:MAG TPA: TolC family protein [Terriglobales bacterium]|nr:TolC family protein [Terriglobales bacterium]